MKKTTPRRSARNNPAAAIEQQAADTDALAAAMPHNANKPLEIGRANAVAPPVGITTQPASPIVGASTLSEANASPKAGAAGSAAPGSTRSGAIDPSRADASGQTLTTNQGVPIADNQNSL